MKTTIFALATMLFATMTMSCSQEEIISENGGQTPLKFRVSTGKVTRANSHEVNELVGDTITIHAVNASGAPIELPTENGTPCSVFYIVPSSDKAVDTYVSIYDPGTTTTTDIYMPADGSDVYFVAFTNSANDDLATQQFTFDGSSITIANYANDPANEFLYAISAAVNNKSESISLDFKHIVSELMFVAASSADGLDIEIMDLSIKVPSKAITWTSADGFTFKIDGTELGTYALSNMETGAGSNPSDGSTTPLEFASLFVLPGTLENFSDDAKLSVTYKILESNEVVFGPETKEVSFKALALAAVASGTPIETWYAGKRYTYTFTPTTVTPLSSYNFVISSHVWEDEKGQTIEPNE